MSSLAAAQTGAPTREVTRVFHSLKSDAEKENTAALAAGKPEPHPAPTRAETDEFLDKQEFHVRNDPDLPDAQKKTFAKHRELARTEPTPDGPSFRVWQDLQAEATVRLTRCPDCGQFSGRRSHACQAGGLSREEAKDKKKTEWREEQDNELARIKDELHEGVSALVTSEGWQKFLDASSKFHNYSLNNQLLIAWQKPDATRVASAKVWKELGREPMPGQKPIGILAPTTRKYVTESKNEETGETEKKEGKRLAGFRAVPTYDISQTDGDPLPTAAVPLEGDAPAGMKADLEAQLTERGFTVSYEEIPGSANGYTTGDGSKRVVIDSRLSPAQQVKTLSHETGHVVMGHLDEIGEYHNGPGGCRGRMEVEAESVAYIVDKSKGLDTRSYSFGYIAGWSGGDPKKAKENAARCLTGAKDILSGSWSNMEAASAIAS